jgi:hypothetical protein
MAKTIIAKNNTNVTPTVIQQNNTTVGQNFSTTVGQDFNPTVLYDTESYPNQFLTVSSNDHDIEACFGECNAIFAYHPPDATGAMVCSVGSRHRLLTAFPHHRHVSAADLSGADSRGGLWPTMRN